MTDRDPVTAAPDRVTTSGARVVPGAPTPTGPISTAFDGDATAIRRSSGAEDRNASSAQDARATSASGSCCRGVGGDVDIDTIGDLLVRDGHAFFWHVYQQH